MLREFLRRLTYWRNREQFDADLAEELEFHAAQSGRAQFGNVTGWTEKSREAWGWTRLETWLQDIRYALRGLRQNPGFAFLAVLTLALAIGANTAIFSLVDAVLIRPLPFADPERLVMIFHEGRHDSSGGNLNDLLQQNRSYSGITVFSTTAMSITGSGAEPERVDAAHTTANYLEVIGTQPLLGRFYREEECEAGRDLVAVISYSLWQRRFGGDKSVIGRTIELNERAVTVIGVMPAGFHFHWSRMEMWTPLTLTPKDWADRNMNYLYAAARLKPGVTAEAAQKEASAIAARLRQQFPVENHRFDFEIVPAHESASEEVRPALLALLGAVAFVLLIACANVAHLLLSRAVRRGNEMAVRLALGAGSGRLIRQMMTENLVLAVLGGLFGILLAQGSFPILKQLIPPVLVRPGALELDARIFTILLGVTLAAALGAGLFPAIQAARTSLNLALRQGGRLSTGQHRARGILVIAEVAAAIILLVGAGLLLQTYARVSAVPPGYDPSGVLTMTTALSPRMRSLPVRNVFYGQVLERLQALPGVESAAFATAIPLTWRGGSSGFTIEGQVFYPGNNALSRQVTPSYFEVFRIRLKAGRLFTAADQATSEPVVIINEEFARRFFPGQDPLNKRFKPGGTASKRAYSRIIGVVENVRETGLRGNPRAITYYAAAQGPYDFTAPYALAVRASGDPRLLAAAVRREVRAINPTQTIASVRLASEILDEEEFAEGRLQSTLIAALAALALVLACIGIYGVISYSVEQRTREFGIRLALGADPRTIVRGILSSGLTLVAAGAAIGLAGAFFLVRFLEKLLFGVRATDPGTFAVVPMVLVLTALAACWIPARRATRIDPLDALRHE